MKEQDIIDRLRRRFPRIGDDAAVIDDQVITTDMLIENVDFTQATPLPFVARKALAVNLSDLAAMGAEPLYALVALGVPSWLDVPVFVDALAAAAEKEEIEIVGGDLSRAEELIVAITAIGRLVGRPLLRNAARPGDRLFLSRPIGGSPAGLFLLRHGWSTDSAPSHVSYAQREFGLSAIRRNVEPEAEIKLGMALAAIDEIHACIDISDGLSTDLHHLCRESRCGALIERERIPLFPDLLSMGTGLGINIQEAVLHGGEEYALLFTSSMRESELSARVGRPVYAIGRITEGREVVIVQDGTAAPLEARGFDHFVSQPIRD